MCVCACRLGSVDISVLVLMWVELTSHRLVHSVLGFKAHPAWLVTTAPKPRNPSSCALRCGLQSARALSVPGQSGSYTATVGRASHNSVRHVPCTDGNPGDPQVHEDVQVLASKSVHPWSRLQVCALRVTVEKSAGSGGNAALLPVHAERCLQERRGMQVCPRKILGLLLLL